MQAIQAEWPWDKIPPQSNGEHENSATAEKCRENHLSVTRQAEDAAKRIGTSDHKFPPGPSVLDEFEPASRIRLLPCTNRISQGKINEPTSRNTHSQATDNTRISIKITNNKHRLLHTHHLGLSKHSTELITGTNSLWTGLHRPCRRAKTRVCSP